ncbi:uncharacterized protein [Choristoneura fumiferana]|uniref:uncharacterized protein n=1 Tax=Choristoneura fumiferana TaxID=7141 RepID=UPI003D15E226
MAAMDENDDYDSDSTVIISDISKNPEKIARKRRKLDEMVRKILHTNINVTNDAQNKASCVPCANKPTDIKQNHNNDPEAIQRRNNQFLSDCDQLAENNNNDSVFEDLKVKKELLKQENNSEEREYCDGEEVKEKEVVIISDDSEDDCTIVTDDANKQVDKNTNFHPRIGVLTPSAINTRRATLDSEKNAIASNISTCETSANPNKINPKVTVLKPSAINSRRASINSFERNEAPSNNNIKHVNLCRSKSKDKEDNDNKGKEPANKKICKTNRLSGHKSYGEHPPKLTPNQNVISRKRNSDGAIHRKPKNSQDNNIILSSKSTDSNIKDAAAVNKKANRHKSTDSSSVIVRTADVIAKNVQDMSGNQEKVDTGVVDINDPNRTNAGHHKTAQINAMHNVCKDPSVTKNNNINNSINDNVIKIHEASNNVMDQTANLGETPIDIGAFGGSKKENANSTNRRKSTDAKRITVDRNELNANVSDSNINTLEYPILEQSKNTVEKNFVPEEDTDILNSDFNTNKQLSNASKSGDVLRVRPVIETPNKDVLCSNTVSHNNNFETPVIGVLRKFIEKNNANQTLTEECSKSDELVSKLNKTSKLRVAHEQHITDHKGKKICFDKRATEFLTFFFKKVNEYLNHVFLDSKLVSKLRASSPTLKREIKCILRHIEKHGASKVRYACPKCSQLSVFSPQGMYPVGVDVNPTLEHNTLKCKLCRALRILHDAHMQNTSDKKYDEVNKPKSRRESASELTLTENNNVAMNRNNGAPVKSNLGTSKSNISVTYDKRKVTDIVVDSLTTTATSAHNDIPTKTNGDTTTKKEKTKEKKKEKSGQSCVTVSNENDEITSGKVKIKFYKRRVDNNVSPINPKRVKTDTRDESTKVVKSNCNYKTDLSSTNDIPTSSFDEPTKLNNKLISSVDTIYNKGGLPRNYDETESREENKAQLTQTLVGCFTKFQTKENYENKYTVNVHTCPECTCIFDSYTSLIEHMRDNHNIPEIFNKITCPLCFVHLNENNYMGHVKVHFPDENTEDGGNEIAIEMNNSRKNLNATDFDTQQQKIIIAKSSENKQYECKICKEVLYSLRASKKHRKQAHGHLDLKKKKLFNVTEKKGVLKSIQSQSSACLENAISEDKNTKKIANPETKSLGSCAMNKLEESENNEINNPEKARDFVERSREQNFDNTNDQRNVTQNCNDDQKESNQEKKRKNNEEINIIQEAKRATLIKSRRESKIKGHENEFNSTQSHITKLLDTSKEIDKNKQSHIAKDNNNSPVNTEIISEPLHESNVQGGASAVAKTSCQTEVDEAEGERNDIDMDDADDSVCESKLPGTDSSPFVDDRSFTQDEDVISREQNKSKCIFPSTSGSKPTLANCYNCSTNIDVIDMDNHHCRQKIVGTLYNCFSCGVSVQHDDTHKCANENNFCIENVQITDVVTVKEVYVFKCEDCSFATDVYDDVIGHCQNHYNDIKDPTAFCETCQLSYHTNYIKEHEYLHEKDLKIISYSYKSLYSNWDKTFEGMPSHILEEMQERSIYKSHCLKMKVINDGPWKYTLYQCNQCETCVAPGKLEQHCRKECDFLGHPCSECNKLFILYAMCENHELDHKKTNVFKTIEFNCKRDERFNSKLFEARRIETLSRIPIVDIFKCVCGICFISNDSLKHHFAGCNLEDKGVLCPRCAVPRLFEVNDLENHLRLHHGAVAYRFRVNSIVIQEYIETCHILDQDLSKTEDDEREGFKEENDDRSV